MWTVTWDRQARESRGDLRAKHLQEKGEQWPALSFTPPHSPRTILRARWDLKLTRDGVDQRFYDLTLFFSCFRQCLLSSSIVLTALLRVCVFYDSIDHEFVKSLFSKTEENADGPL